MTDTELHALFDQHRGLCGQFARVPIEYRFAEQPDLCAMILLNLLAPVAPRVPMIVLSGSDHLLLFRVHGPDLLRSIRPPHVMTLICCGATGWHERCSGVYFDTLAVHKRRSDDSLFT
jgi:hypothetical protein